MQIHITGKHVEVPATVRDYAEEKAGKLQRYYDRLRSVEVILGHESELFTAEMIVHVDKGPQFVAYETGPDTIALIDLVVDKLERQLTKYKEKVRVHKHDGRGTPPVE